MGPGSATKDRGPLLCPAGPVIIGQRRLGLRPLDREWAEGAICHGVSQQQLPNCPQGIRRQATGGLITADSCCRGGVGGGKVATRHGVTR